MEGCLEYVPVVDAIKKLLTPHELLVCRSVSRKWCQLFSVATVLKRFGLPTSSATHDVMSLRAARVLVFADVWDLPVWETLAPFWRRAQAVENVVQGYVRKISIKGSLYDGSVVGTVQASMASKQHVVSSLVRNRVAQVPSCDCVTG